MILTTFIVGLVITYLTVGLVAGRTYLVLKLKHWHNTVGVHMKTRNQLRQENELEKLEARNKYQSELDKRTTERQRLEKKLDNAKDTLFDLKQEKRRLERLIELEGSETHASAYDTLCFELKKASGQVEQAADDLNYYRKVEARRPRLSEQSFMPYSSKYCKLYEDERDKEKDELNPTAIAMIFLWPAMATWFVGFFSVKKAIKFGDRVLHAEKVNNYVAPEEHKLEAKIKALTEKDPELAKMYAELAKTLEA